MGMLSKTREHELRVDHLIKMGEIYQAIKLLETQGRRDPTNLRVLNLLGDLYLRVGDGRRAANAFLSLEEHFSRQGYYSKSIAVLRKAIRADPYGLEIYERLASAYESQGLNAEAAKQLELVAAAHRKRGRLTEARSAEGRAALLLEQNHGQGAAVRKKKNSKVREAAHVERRDHNGRLCLEGESPLWLPSLAGFRVFLCHASPDKGLVRSIYSKLLKDRLRPWLDEEDLLPGQNWKVEIGKAVRSSEAVAVCLSKRSLTKRGFYQKEIRIALDVLQEQPQGTIFLIPIRLEECAIPESLTEIQYVDLFATGGYKKLLRAFSLRSEQLAMGNDL